MQPDKLAPMFSSLLCDSIGILRKTHFEGKANSELSQTSPVENISDEDWRGLVKHWSDPKYQVHYIYM